MHVFKPRSSGEGVGRAWYPPLNSGSSAYFTLKAGAEMTCQEVRFIPVRFKDAYGPVGAWFLLFKSRATNAFGGEYMVERRPELENWKPYGQVKPIPANLRNYLGMLDVMEGKGPIYMRTEEAIQRIADKARREGLQEEDEGARERGLGRLPRHDHLAGHPVGRHQHPARGEVLRDRGCRAVLHRFPLRCLRRLGQRSQGPLPPEYFWGYENMSTVKGLFAAGDASGASSHKFSSGSHAEGRIAGKAAIRYIVNENPPMPTVADATIEELKTATLKPLDTFAEHKDTTSQTDVNPNYILPKMFMFRLQKLMDEYAGGVGSQFTTSKLMLREGPRAARLPQGGRRESGRRGSARADAMLGEQPPHVPGRGPRPDHPVP